MALTQILPMRHWIEIQNDLFKIFNLQGGVFNTEGIRITKTKNWSNRLCPAIKSIDKGQRFICAVAHMNLAHKAMKQKAPVIGECDAGLVKLVVPVLYRDVCSGVVGGCGLLPEGVEVDVFSVHKLTGMDEKTIETLAADIQAITRKDALSACEHIKGHLDRAKPFHWEPSLSEPLEKGPFGNEDRSYITGK